MKNKLSKNGKLIMHWLIDQDMNRTDLAKKLGITQAFVSLVLQGKRKTPITWYDMLPSNISDPIITEEIEKLEDRIEELKGKLR